MDKKYAWKLIPPKDGEPPVKKVLIDGKTKTYYWCPNHHEWTIHPPSECRKQPFRMKRKTRPPPPKGAIDRSNFKNKKKAYLQAKAAYHACMADSWEEQEESSDSDNDEDSNKSTSSYSSEGSNTS